MDAQIKAHFGCCDHCEPIMCCTGLANQCGCMGYPVDFKHTDKCGDDCDIRKFQEPDLKLAEERN